VPVLLESRAAGDWGALGVRARSRPTPTGRPFFCRPLLCIFSESVRAHLSIPTSNAKSKQGSVKPRTLRPEVQDALDRILDAIPVGASFLYQQEEEQPDDPKLVAAFGHLLKRIPEGRGFLYSRVTMPLVATPSPPMSLDTLVVVRPVNAPSSLNFMRPAELVPCQGVRKVAMAGYEKPERPETPRPDDPDRPESNL